MKKLLTILAFGLVMNTAIAVDDIVGDATGRLGVQSDVDCHRTDMSAARTEADLGQGTSEAGAAEAVVVE